MAKRLTMTNADYLTIAISPALIMALVGSLVFFLIEVLYVGQYQARMNYAFALFVFAAVLIARISIEMGSDHAALFALPLGIVMFLFLLRFVDQPNAFGQLINLALLGLVWWCAHQLTWDSTVIDDDEDASGEGLMQRVGVDDPAGAKTDNSTAAGAKDNELFASSSANSKLVPWWQQPLSKKGGPHTPGLWVLYFSLAALPLFGIGQHWIPVAEVGRRRYVFALLLVYVAAALALLVTTSFLNLRRYLRQRHVEMPLPIAGTWVGVGAVLIVVVMLLAALIPRPGAEIALSRVPWQRSSSDNLRASQKSVVQDRGGKRSPETAANDTVTANDGQNNGQDQRLEQDGNPSSTRGESADAGDDSSTKREGENSGSAVDEASDRAGVDQSGKGSDTGKSESGQSTQKARDAGQANSQSNSKGNEPTAETREQAESDRAPSSPHSGDAKEALQKISAAVSGLTGVLKILFYAFLALLLAFFAWRYRDRIVQALADILSQLRALFGGKAAIAAVYEEQAALLKARPASFNDFHDPFSTGQHSRMSPEELVRYSFAAFEAWANDRGRTRTPNCTPHELVVLALDPESPMYEPARQLVRLYGEMAYASRRVPPESANELEALWQMMKSTHSLDVAIVATS
ncbi:MAG: DUF4129 domain-containing protein [Pirellulales bacterium]